MRSGLLALLAFFAAVAAAAAEPIPVGRERVEFPFANAPLTLFTYKPVNYNGGPLLVVFHGVVRNAEQYRDFAISMADRVGVIVVSPCSPSNSSKAPTRQLAGTRSARQC